MEFRSDRWDSNADSWAGNRRGRERVEFNINDSISTGDGNRQRQQPRFCRGRFLDRGEGKDQQRRGDWRYV